MSNYKRLFLDDYCYFFTVVTYKRNPILINTIHLLKQSFKKAKNNFDFNIIAITVLPDHFHMIIKINQSTDYPKIIGTMKRYFSKNCPEKHYKHLSQSPSREQQKYKPIWQKRYYEHTI